MIEEPIFILAGGLGTRLRSLSAEKPKVLAPVNGTPFISVNLELLRRAGFQNFVLCLGYGAEQIEAFLGDGSRWGISISYSYDDVTKSNSALGTAHAIRKALKFTRKDFWLLNGDTFLPLDFARVRKEFNESEGFSTIAICNAKEVGSPANVELAGMNVNLYRKGKPTPKMTYVDAGLGYFSKDVFLENSDLNHLPELYERLSLRGDLRAVKIRERYYDINTPESLVETERYLASNHSDLRLE